MAERKTRKCPWCKQFGQKAEMVAEQVGVTRPSERYYHLECHRAFSEEKAVKEAEQAEKDRLVETIQRIYGMKELPRQVYPFLEHLRHGNPVFGSRQQLTRRYREGYTYALIEKTFEYVEDSIVYSLAHKEFQSSLSAIKYGLAIVIDKIYFVEQREKKKESQQALTKRREQAQAEDHSVSQPLPAHPRTDEMDISDFLD